MKTCTRLVVVAAAMMAMAWSTRGSAQETSGQGENPSPVDRKDSPTADSNQNKPIPKFLDRGLEWLIAAQHPNGGWGSGSHARQDIKDPHQIQVDPATTSFVGLALFRAGHTPVSGEYQKQVRKAVRYLVRVVEDSSANGPKITDLEGTQPQTKLGPLVDTSLTAQYLARILPTIPQNDKLYKRVDAALDRCLTKLSASQQQDGSWGRNGGWAPVLQSSLSCSALEIAATTGKQVDKDVLDRARKYQQGNVDGLTGRARGEASAGVELYAFAGGGRGNAAEARQAQDAVKQAVREGRVDEKDAAAPTAETLAKAGYGGERGKRMARAFAQNEAQLNRLNDETLIAGFGNNGGEEFLSYTLTSETLVISGGEKFAGWNKKMKKRLKKVQNDDGSWSGHHCITSPVFCTAAVVQCLTTARDAEFLVSIAKKQAEALAAK